MSLGERGRRRGSSTRLTSAEIADVVSLKLSLVGLAAFEEFYPAELSGGIISGPGWPAPWPSIPTPVLDEPSAGLDPVTSSRLDDDSPAAREPRLHVRGGDARTAQHPPSQIRRLPRPRGAHHDGPGRTPTASSPSPRTQGPRPSSPTRQAAPMAQWAARPGRDRAGRAMRKRASPTVIGVFVLVAVALAVTGILALGKLRIFPGRDDLGGLLRSGCGRPQHRLAGPLPRGPDRPGQCHQDHPRSAGPDRRVSRGRAQARSEEHPVYPDAEELQPAVDEGLRAPSSESCSFVTGQLWRRPGLPAPHARHPHRAGESGRAGGAHRADPARAVHQARLEKMSCWTPSIG